MSCFTLPPFLEPVAIETTIFVRVWCEVDSLTAFRPEGPADKALGLRHSNQARVAELAV